MESASPPAKRRKMDPNEALDKVEAECDAAAAAAAAKRKAARKDLPRILVEEGDGKHRWSSPTEIADRIPRPKEACRLWAEAMWRIPPCGRRRINGAEWFKSEKEEKDKYEEMAKEDAKRYEEACRRHWDFYDDGRDFYVYK